MNLQPGEGVSLAHVQCVPVMETTQYLAVRHRGAPHEYQAHPGSDCERYHISHRTGAPGWTSSDPITAHFVRLPEEANEGVHDDTHGEFQPCQKRSNNKKGESRTAHPRRVSRSGNDQGSKHG